MQAVDQFLNGGDVLLRLGASPRSLLQLLRAAKATAAKAVPAKSAATKPANGLFSSMVTLSSPSAVQDS
mgnify:CR=1 FL=1